MMYCMQPGTGLIGNYNRLVEDAREEINSLHSIFDSKKLDCAKLTRENSKFLGENGSKRSWMKYEKLLGIERVVNTRLIDKL